MLVDDEEIVLQSLVSYLELETDYDVVTYKNPIDALDFFKKKTVDLVISDFLMPEMDGLRFLSEIRKKQPEVVRVLLTGYADKENAIKGINEVGLFQYIEKPWDNDSLKLIIRNAITAKSLKEILETKIRELDGALLERDSLAEQNELIRQELNLARQVQESLLPQELPNTNSISLKAKYQPALDIGGDFYDIIPLAGEKQAILVADVTGHGIQAALSTVLLKSAFSTFENQDAASDKILSYMNSVLRRGLPKGIFVAALLAIFDHQTHDFRISNAGLPFPFYIRRNVCEVEHIHANGLLLGITDEHLYQPSDEHVIHLEEGDCILLYTDGISETPNKKDEHFDDEVMSNVLQENCQKPGHEIIDIMIAAAREFSSPDHRWDDITLLTVEKISKTRNTPKPT